MWAHLDARYRLGRGRSKFRVVLEDRPLEVPQLRTGLDAEIVRQPAPRIAVRLERIALPADQVEGAHQLAPQPLAVGMLRDERLELVDERGRGAGGEIGLDPFLRRAVG